MTGAQFEVETKNGQFKVEADARTNAGDANGRGAGRAGGFRDAMADGGGEVLIRRAGGGEGAGLEGGEGIGGVTGGAGGATVKEQGE